MKTQNNKNDKNNYILPIHLLNSLKNQLQYSPRFFYQIESEGGLSLSNYKTQKDFVYYDDYWKYIIDKNMKEAQQRYETELCQRHEDRRINAAILVIAICAVLCLAFSGIVIRSAEIYQAKYEIHIIQSEIRDMQLEVEELRAHIDNTVSLNHVESVALNELKMQYPESSQIVYIASNWNYAMDDITEDSQLAEVEKGLAFAAKLN